MRPAQTVPRRDGGISGENTHAVTRSPPSAGQFQQERVETVMQPEKPARVTATSKLTPQRVFASFERSVRRMIEWTTIVGTESKDIRRSTGLKCSLNGADTII